MSRPVDLRERLESLPGLDRLLAELDGLPPAFLVGGTVRDLLRGAGGVDLDVAIEGDARAAARSLAQRLGGEAVEHERFGTATVSAPGLSLDLAGTRRERYPRPGALPEVAPASLGDDLARRDFTVNAMAIGLNGGDLGRLYDPHGGREDLGAGVVRVLHERSFSDDPTRLLRAVRYEARLGFRLDPQTERLAVEAVRRGALRQVSGKRVRDELIDLLAEPSAPSAAARLAELGLDRAMHPDLRADPELLASAQLGCAETGAAPALAGLSTLLLPAVADAPDVGASAAAAWVDDLQLAARDRDAVLRAAARAPALVAALREPLAPSEVCALLGPEPPEALALALGLGAEPAPILAYVGDLRHVRLDIGGSDLVDAGVPRSPAIGRALAATLRRKLDGELSGREAELRSALAIARGERQP